MKKILVIGGTGVMGHYVVENLLQSGYHVDAVTLDDVISEKPCLKYYKNNFLDFRVAADFLKNRHYDAIIDFMTYNTAQYAERYELLLESADHFIFVSSYRVYSDQELPTVETSPRLLDVVEDKEFLASDDYSLFKAREENILRGSKYKNWTIVRPAITYSNQRIAFVTLELPLMMRRAKAGKPIYIPEEVLNVEACCTWAGDVASLICNLLFKEKAYGEAFSVCSAEHHTWGIIAGYYKEILNADIRTVPIQDYLNFFGNKQVNSWQLYYDRCMQRVMDNRKVLKITGMSQDEFMPLREGLEKMIHSVQKDYVWPEYTQLWNVDKAMDLYTELSENTTK